MLNNTKHVNEKTTANMQGGTHCCAELESTMWTLSNHPKDGRVAESLSLELAALLSRHRVIEVRYPDSI